MIRLTKRRWPCELDRHLADRLLVLCIRLGGWINNFVRDGDHKSRLANIAVFDPFFPKFGEHAERFPLLCVTQTQLSLGINSNDTGLLIL
jgi:hypothetical protein